MSSGQPSKGRWVIDPTTGERVWASPRPRVYLTTADGPVLMSAIEAKMAELVDRCDDDVTAYDQIQSSLADAEKEYHRFVLLKSMELRKEIDETTGKHYTPATLKLVVEAYAVDLSETVRYLEASERSLSKSLAWMGHQKDLLQSLAANQRAQVSIDGRR